MRNLLKFGVVLSQYLLFFIIQPLTVRPYKATAWLVYRVGGGLYAHIPLSISCFLPFLFLLFIGYNCLVTLVVKSNHRYCGKTAPNLSKFRLWNSFLNVNFILPLQRREKNG